MTIKLQGIYNQQAAKAAKELKTGDVIVWNYGYTSTVVDLMTILHGKYQSFQLYTQPSSGRLPVLILSAQCRGV